MSKRKIYEGLPLPDFLSPPARQGTVIDVQSVSKQFGGIRAVTNTSLTVEAGEIHALIGPNGAGKTTAFNCITGFYTPNAGTVRYRDRDVTKASPHQKAAMGFGRTFQNVGMVKSATALENLKTAQHAKASYDAASGLLGVGRTWQGERAMTARAEADMARMTREMIDAVTALGGSYYLPYRPHATREQFRAAYPRWEAFVRTKREADPGLSLRNAFWDRYLAEA